MNPRVFRCWRCNKRLPVDDVEGAIKVIVYCGHCKAKNSLDEAPKPSFRQQIEVKA